MQRGQLGMPTPPTASSGRRPLGPSQSTPVLNFGGNSAPFVTTNSTLSSVFGDVKRNELQPFFNNIHEDQAERSRRSASQRSLEGSGLFGSSAGGYQTRETTAMDNDGDGFDMDEVFGESSIKFPSALSSQPSFGAQEESQTSTGTTRTITQRMKRAYDEGAEGNAGADSDEEMAATDVEDEGEDVVQPSMFSAPVGRRIGGRRGLSKTQSLPASVFNGADF